MFKNIFILLLPFLLFGCTKKYSEEKINYVIDKAMIFNKNNFLNVFKTKSEKDEFTKILSEISLKKNEYDQISLYMLNEVFFDLNSLGNISSDASEIKKHFEYLASQIKKEIINFNKDPQLINSLKLYYLSCALNMTMVYGSENKEYQAYYKKRIIDQMIENKIVYTKGNLICLRYYCQILQSLEEYKNIKIQSDISDAKELCDQMEKNIAFGGPLRSYFWYGSVNPSAEYLEVRKKYQEQTKNYFSNNDNKIKNRIIYQYLNR